MASSYTEAKGRRGGGCHKNIIDAPSLDALDAMIAQARQDVPSKDEVISVRDLAAKVGMDVSSMRSYIKGKGIPTFWARYDGVAAKYLRLDQAAQVVQMRIAEGRPV